MLRSTAIAQALTAIKAANQHLAIQGHELNALIEEVGAAVAFANAQELPIDALASCAVVMADYIEGSCEEEIHPESAKLRELAAKCSTRLGTAIYPRLSYGARNLDDVLALEVTVQLGRIYRHTPEGLPEHLKVADALSDLSVAFDNPAANREFGTGAGAELAHYIGSNGSNHAYERYCNLIASDEEAVSSLAIEMTLDRYAASVAAPAAF